MGPILFIIAILAIIAAAIAAGSSSFNANTVNESNKVDAQALVQYADQLKNSVQKVMADNSCSDTQLQFQGSNPNAPSDGSCNIFDPRGGGIVDLNFTNLNGAFNTAMATNNNNWANTYGHFTQGFMSPIVGVGNPANAPLLFQLMDVSLGVCTSINSVVGFNAASSYAPPSVNWFKFYNTNTGYFFGQYFSDGPYDIGFSNGAVQGCVYDNQSGYGEYDYVGVLLAR